MRIYLINFLLSNKRIVTSITESNPFPKNLSSFSRFFYQKNSYVSVKTVFTTESHLGIIKNILDRYKESYLFLQTEFELMLSRI